MYEMGCLAFFLCMLVFSPLSVSAADRVVEAVGEAAFSETTIPVVKAAALNDARRNALEEAVGVAVRGTSVVYNSELISDMVQTATKGLIVKEEVLYNNCDIRNDQIHCSAKIRAHVRPLNLEKRGNYRFIRAGVVRPAAAGRMMKLPVFQDGEEIQVRLKVNMDSFLNIFSVDQYGNISKLYPNRYVKQELIPARREFVFPDETLRKLGLRLRVSTPGKLSRAVESLLLIATTEQIPLLEDAEVENPTISDLMRELSSIPPSRWVDRTVGYEVRKE